MSILSQALEIDRDRHFAAQRQQPAVGPARCNQSQALAHRRRDALSGLLPSSLEQLPRYVDCNLLIRRHG